MNKIIFYIIIFILISAKPIELPFMIQIDDEKNQRYNDKNGIWNDNFFEESELSKKIEKVIFDKNKFLFPLKIKKINDKFGGPRYHLGVDYYGKTGDIIVSSFSGYVIESGINQSVGKYIIIKNEEKKICFLYGHLSKVYLKENDDVEIGQIIGRIGNTGNSTGEHLHLEIYYQNVYMNHDLIFD